MFPLLPLRSHNIHGHTVVCPVSAEQVDAVTAIDQTISVPGGRWERIAGIVTSTLIKDLQVSLANSQTTDSVLVAPYTSPAGVLLPVQVGLPDQRETMLKLRVTGTKLVGDLARITLLLIPLPLPLPSED